VFFHLHLYKISLVSTHRAHNVVSTLKFGRKNNINVAPMLFYKCWFNSSKQTANQCSFKVDYTTSTCEVISTLFQHGFNVQLWLTRLATYLFQHLSNVWEIIFNVDSMLNKHCFVHWVLGIDNHRDLVYKYEMLTFTVKSSVPLRAT
jgi:hypothetical protein